MSTNDEAPNLLDAALGADAEGIIEMLDEIARRIGARGIAISITFSATEIRGERHARICLRGHKLPHPVADNMAELIERATTLRKRKAKGGESYDRSVLHEARASARPSDDDGEPEPDLVLGDSGIGLLNTNGTEEPNKP